MDFIIEDVWSVEQEILDVFHKVCIENDLKYSLGYGTLLGAIRHGGFIPWDDDVDVLMPREDYNKLLEIWNEVAPKEYIIQDYNTDDDYTNNFAKIRKNHTTFLQDEIEREKKYQKGFFIDVFPADRVASGKISRIYQYFSCAVNLLYSRQYSSGSDGVMGLFERILLSTPKKNYAKRRNKAERIITKWNKFEKGKYIFPCTMKSCKIYFPSDLFESIESIEFNGKEYCSIKNPEVFLSIMYGNYMELPAIEKRVWVHHPILVSFDKNYEDLEKI